jgi:hypothetical protein
LSDGAGKGGKTQRREGVVGTGAGGDTEEEACTVTWGFGRTLGYNSISTESMDFDVSSVEG